MSSEGFATTVALLELGCSGEFLKYGIIIAGYELLPRINFKVEEQGVAWFLQR